MQAYGVGDVDVLHGPRLDELAADEEANPRLRARGGDRSAVRTKANREQSITRLSRRVDRQIGMSMWGFGRGQRQARTYRRGGGGLGEPAGGCGGKRGDHRRPAEAGGCITGRRTEQGGGQEFASVSARMGARGEEGLPERERTARSIGSDRPAGAGGDAVVGFWIGGRGSGVGAVAASGVLFVSCSVGIVAMWAPATETEDDEDDWMSPCLSEPRIWCGLTRPGGSNHVFRGQDVLAFFSRSLLPPGSLGQVSSFASFRAARNICSPHGVTA